MLQVHDIGETDTGQPYLVLELAAGGDLASRWDGPAYPASVSKLARWLGDVLTVVLDVGLVLEVEPHLPPQLQLIVR